MHCSRETVVWSVGQDGHDRFVENTPGFVMLKRLWEESCRTLVLNEEYCLVLCLGPSNTKAAVVTKKRSSAVVMFCLRLSFYASQQAEDTNKGIGYHDAKPSSIVGTLYLDGRSICLSKTHPQM